MLRKTKRNAITKTLRPSNFGGPQRYDEFMTMPDAISTAPLSGTQYVIRLGDQQATIASIGAAVREYQVGGRDVFVPYDADQVSPVYNAAILAPWPNRLAGGRYEFAGVVGQLPVNELDRVNALHGLVCWADWVEIDAGENYVKLAYELPARAGWPFQMLFVVTYTLQADGLHCEFIAANIGKQPAPYGVGFHPWLSSGGAALDECDVRLDANEHVLTDDRLLPVGVEPVAGNSDLRVRRSLRGLDLDDAWLAPTYDGDGRSWCILYCPDGVAPAIWMDSSCPAWQVCSSDHIPNYYRFGLAAEPMTCVADAFNTGDLLITLAPGEKHTVNWGATLLNQTDTAAAGLGAAA